MLYRPLGATGLSVSEIGLGCASYWGKPGFSETTALRIVHEALDRGVTFLDTGASYSRGEAEPRLGRALKGRDPAGLVVATKAGTRHAGGGRIVREMTAGAIVASAETSLRHLHLDHLPLLQLHGPAISELSDDVLDALASLKARGLVRALGVNSFDPAVIDHVIGLPLFDVVMVDYNVLRPERAPLVAKAAGAGKGVLAGMALAMGHAGRRLLRLRGPQDLWYAARALARHPRELGAGRRFAFLHRLASVTGPQAALAYVLADPNVACAVIGTTRLPHLIENLGASGLTLDREVMAAIAAAQAS
jgi:aryl-alcohol dehydrogenase-like predicted oxidoreductase